MILPRNGASRGGETQDRVDLPLVAAGDVPFEQVADDRGGHNHGESRARALNDAEEQHDRHGRREGASDGGNKQRAQAGQDDRPAPKAVGKRSADQGGYAETGQKNGQGKRAAALGHVESRFHGRKSREPDGRAEGVQAGQGGQVYQKADGPYLFFLQAGTGRLGFRTFSHGILRGSWAEGSADNRLRDTQSVTLSA